MIRTTQCFIRRGSLILMLYRNKKPNDPNEGKWIGIGGKVEAGETPEEANIREVYEETGIRIALEECLFHGIVRFHNTEYEDEEISLYSAAVPDGTEFLQCEEGELHWVEADKLPALNMWDGDRLFVGPVLEGRRNLEIELFYEGDRLVGQKIRQT